MENIIEKSIVKEKEKKDKVIVIFTVVFCIILCAIPFFIKGMIGYTPVILLILIYTTYRIVVSRNIEYEYEFVEDSFTISKIINKSYRKLIIKSSLSEFDIIAPLNSKHYEEIKNNVQIKLKATSNINKQAEYFGIIQYKGKRTCVIFESNDKILSHIKNQIDYKLKR